MRTRGFAPRHDLAVDLAVSNAGCRRGLTDVDCNVRCCAACDAHDRLDGQGYCGPCLIDMETDERARRADLREQIWHAALHGTTPLELRGNIRR